MPDFGSVLRGLGSVLNPQVMQEEAQADARKQAMGNQMGMLAFQKRIEEQSPEYQAKMEALTNERAFRQEAAAAGGDMARIAAAASKYGKPEVAVGIFKAQEDRAARSQAAKDALELRHDQLAQQKDLALQRASDQKDRDAIMAGFKQQSLDLQSQIARASEETKRIQLGIQQQLADAKTSGGPGKPLPVPVQKQLTEAAQTLDASDRFVSTFKPEFAGKTLTGSAGNVAGRIFGDDTGQSQWWQDYDLHQAVVRNKLFGASLTAPEIAEWNKSAISPRMDPEQVKTNLARRKELEETGLHRLMRGTAAGGYNSKQIEEYTGRPIPAERAAPAASNVPPPPPGFNIVKAG